MPFSNLLLQLVLATAIRPPPLSPEYVGSAPQETILDFEINDEYPADAACLSEEPQQTECEWPLSPWPFQRLGKSLWHDGLKSDNALRHYKAVWKALKASKKVGDESRVKALDCNLETLVLKAFGEGRPAGGLLKAYCAALEKEDRGAKKNVLMPQTSPGRVSREGSPGLPTAKVIEDRYDQGRAKK
eukprot:CAMPEP_0197658836 /NCGR_PEP_ID=MMETSP1338-20131121/45474_1 /TAXON_ID=43686 ORGANISM="Pelagodinium beii, Strain RCC1491" /NCGR_SAMPLE_ID=MMETSP1338 /ASSEMBLY_ACC=CAM_ASM_000754 /LENGTH=186 /DNA_ID=CAMNT_0043235499 /DNA_START=41 /DNA_END=598 /DNA_ORIENTATION=-